MPPVIENYVSKPHSVRAIQVTPDINLAELDQLVRNQGWSIQGAWIANHVLNVSSQNGYGRPFYADDGDWLIFRSGPNGRLSITNLSDEDFHKEYVKAE